jgi:hypothetical protein
MSYPRCFKCTQQGAQNFANSHTARIRQRTIGERTMERLQNDGAEGRT